VQITMLLSEPKTDIQLDTLVSLANDREEYSRKEVFKIMERCKLQDRHYKMLQEMLKYKSADMRKKIIDLLFKQKNEKILESARELVTDKKEEKRTAGLDMIIRVSESDSDEDIKKEFTDLVSLIEKPTSKEQILIDRISGETKAANDEEGYGLYKESDSYEPEFDKDFVESCKADFIKLFPNTTLFGNKPKGKLTQALAKAKKGDKDLDLNTILTLLDKLIEEHKNDEYTDYYGETKLLAGTNGYGSFMLWDASGRQTIPFKELWDKFYDEYVHDGLTAYKLSLVLSGAGTFSNKILGEEYDLKASYMHLSRMGSIIRYLKDQHFNSSVLFTAGIALIYHIAYEAKKEDLYGFMDLRYGSKDITFYLDGEKLEFNFDTPKSVLTIINDEKLRTIIGAVYSSSDFAKEHFKDVFALKCALGKRFGYFELSNNNTGNYQLYYTMRKESFTPFTVETLILAGYRGVISEGFMYKMLINRELSAALDNLSLLISFKKSGETSMKSRFWYNRSCEGFIKSLIDLPFSTVLSEHEFTEEDNKRIDYANDIGEKILDIVLRTEMSRGDTETKFTYAIGSIKRIYGAERLVTILAAMGKDTIDRSSYFYTYNGVSKKRSLSYLLGVCVPEATDNVDKFRELISKTDVKENRIVEAALFAPAWLDIVGDYLGWDGFRSACYYFIAHTNETMDDKMKAVIAKYTPISAEDLSDGAFDIDWCREAYTTIGEKRFDQIYTAAKYISDGAKHSRARKYADAVMGKLNKDECIKNITEKRNKDTLMAYALIPLENEKDMIDRYLFIQEFKKQSKKFGAQRKASETKASELALQNLSKNAGFTDVSRLTLKMETKLFD
ncbi:MAG: hypothetical protein K2J79_06775, partial [Ruminiclostridium sp.]|nr:hypothetical protein [Ruminiclostridium sp.]